ncbi:hypothetical protein FO519_008210 [Halicephalobus sp. NKZ332]|nr:hypothetical protein FO519_008210 [Halicephalobus sp. NKZ332]
MDQQQASSSGSLKISLKLGGIRREPERPNKKPCPFHCMKESLPPSNPILGSKDLISYVDLGAAYQKYCIPGKLKPDLASFLPQLCHTANMCSSISGSTSLRTLIEKPPITGKAIDAPNDMKGFQLVSGSVTEAYQLFDTRDAHRLVGAAPTMTGNEEEKVYDEFGQNYGDSEATKKAHRPKQKRALEDPEILDEKKVKKHKKEKKKSKKDKKKDRERKEAPDERGASFY